MFMIFANANPSKGYKGITCFLVPAGTPGLIVGKKVRSLSLWSARVGVLRAALSHFAALLWY